MSHNKPSDGARISVRVQGNLKRQDGKQSKTKKIFVKDVRTQNEASRATLPWANNLPVMWALDFLLWVIPA